MKIIIKPIKNRDDYLNAMACMEELVSLDPEPGTEKSDQMLVLEALIESYEEANFPIEPPSAVEAIKFRMEQLDMKTSDLAPYVGSASRASEILSGKRHLTVSMIRALSAGLHIPEKALLKEESDDNEFSRNIPNAVFKQMIKRGYFDDGVDSENKAHALKEFFDGIELLPNALYRRSDTRINSKTSPYALVAWSDRILKKGKSSGTPKPYNKNMNLELMRKIAKLSTKEDGPRLAIRELSKNGITVIIEPPLDGAKVDGVTIMQDKTHPIIGLSLRYDRLDNFWFTLMHELAHIALHLDYAEDFIYDDLDCPINDGSEKEKQADELASEALVDTAEWLASPARIIPSPLAAQALADKLGIHIAIVAGKARFEDGNWKYLSNVVNEYKIREKFGDIKW